MDNFFVLSNSLKDPNMETTLHIQHFLKSKGKICEIQSRKLEENLQIPESAECVIVLGGDGTVLRVARELAGKNTPILGVNLGTLGYLAEVESSNLDEALEQLVKGKYEIEDRMMLTGIICGQETKNKNSSNCALNDVVITRKGSLQVMNYNIYVNGQLLNCFHADGIIVSTPTGSTGYNLSAGGPIVEPKAKLILLTPICPHTLNTRSVVLPAEDVITVEVGIGRGGECQDVTAFYDGSIQVPMSTGDRLEIGQSRQTTKIIKLSHVSFLEILHQKMSE